MYPAEQGVTWMQIQCCAWPGILIILPALKKRVEILRDGQLLKSASLDVQSRVLQRVPIDTAGGEFRVVVKETVPGTEVKWRQTFDTVEHYERIAQFVASANEQNLDRLAAEVQNGMSAA